MDREKKIVERILEEEGLDAQTVLVALLHTLADEHVKHLAAHEPGPSAAALVIHTLTRCREMNQERGETGDNLDELRVVCCSLAIECTCAAEAQAQREAEEGCRAEQARQKDYPPLRLAV